ncbi:unnamed protein product [Sphagnum jensenii]|uniref:Uncharacterized protein n=1 Tax=Sphagnum jensenii TaxID=128206 RepID=A0ABP1BJZ3_9BRYO
MITTTICGSIMIYLHDAHSEDLRLQQLANQGRDIMFDGVFGRRPKAEPSALFTLDKLNQVHSPSPSSSSAPPHFSASL